MTLEEKIELSERKSKRCLVKGKPLDLLWEYGSDILLSPSFQKEKRFVQHGSYSVYDHSCAVALLCLVKAKQKHWKVDVRSLVRAALLHDYFLYDWHVKPHPKHHANLHAEYALANAGRDFSLNVLEKEAIRRHMWPFRFFYFPTTKEALILNICDTHSALKETIGKRWFKKEIAMLEERVVLNRTGDTPLSS